MARPAPTWAQELGLSIDTSGRALIGVSGTVRVQLEWSKPKTDGSDVG